ncbi:MAG: hypothetical protein OQJ91_05590 [Motiliproteus sp.]|nr:hypothetical protein [Motiliproteus sp.]
MRQLLIAFTALMLISSQSLAYSYAAAGKEPLLEGWTAISQSLSEKQLSSATQQLDAIEDELVNLESEADVALVWRLKTATKDLDVKAAGVVFSDIFRAVIDLRLQQAQENINEYQLAKVHVAKSKRYLDLLLNDIDLLARVISAEQKQKANTFMADCFSALGKPGLFGAGNTPANPTAFEKAHAGLINSLSVKP